MEATTCREMMSVYVVVLFEPITGRANTQAWDQHHYLFCDERVWRGFDSEHISNKNV